MPHPGSPSDYPARHSNDVRLLELAKVVCDFVEVEIVNHKRGDGHYLRGELSLGGTTYVWEEGMPGLDFVQALVELKTYVHKQE